MNYKCPFCDLEFSVSNKFIAHKRFCKLNPDYQKNLNQIKTASKLGVAILNKISKDIYFKNNPLETHMFICEYCKNEFRRDVRHNNWNNKKNLPRFCSERCARLYSNQFIKRKSISNTLKNKNNVINKHICPRCKNEFESTSISNKKLCPRCRSKICIICNKEFIQKNNEKTCSNECYRKLLSKKVQERIKNGTHKGWVSRKIISYPEKFFMTVLKNNNIEYKHNYTVHKKDLEINEASCYFLDFLLENKFDLEIDGDQHKFRKDSDHKRDELLTKNGYTVYRIPWNEINSENGKQQMKQKIDDFLDFYNKRK